MKTIRYARFSTSVGQIFYTHDGTNIISIKIAKDPAPSLEGRLGGGTSKKSPLKFQRHKGFEKEIREYAKGNRSIFRTGIKLEGLPPFTTKVLNALKRVPFGKTVSYRDLARRVGKPKAVRAVGNAMSANPLPIIIPCHRVIKSDGSIGGFTGGLKYKIKLLGIEGVKIS